MEFCRSRLLVIFVFVLQIFSQHNVSSIGEVCDQALGNSAGFCINMKNCQPYMELLRKQGAAAGNILRGTLCYYENNDPVVCCPSNAVQPTKPTVPPVQPTTDTSSTYGPLYAPQCGHSDAQHNRIVGGSPAELGAWPWITALGYRNKKTNTPDWLCGGSLISARHVLTAAHCVFNRYDLYMARLGDLDLSSNTDGANPIDVPIRRGTLHPGYSNITHINDIAVLRLKYEITFTDSIHPICLPLIPEIKNQDFVRYNPFIAGWGAVFFHGPRSSTLLEAQVTVVSLQECKNAYVKHNYVVGDKVICAGNPNGATDACKGDSGGPMMYPIGTTYYLIGVISLGYRCADPYTPGIFTRVSEYLEFISDNLN